MNDFYLFKEDHEGHCSAPDPGKNEEGVLGRAGKDRKIEIAMDEGGAYNADDRHEDLERDPTIIDESYAKADECR